MLVALDLSFAIFRLCDDIILSYLLQLGLSSCNCQSKEFCKIYRYLFDFKSTQEYYLRLFGRNRSWNWLCEFIWKFWFRMPANYNWAIFICNYFFLSIWSWISYSTISWHLWNNNGSLKNWSQKEHFYEDFFEKVIVVCGFIYLRFSVTNWPNLRTLLEKEPKVFFEKPVMVKLHMLVIGMVMILQGF